MSVENTAIVAATSKRFIPSFSLLSVARPSWRRTSFDANAGLERGRLPVSPANASGVSPPSDAVEDLVSAPASAGCGATSRRSHAGGSWGYRYAGPSYQKSLRRTLSSLGPDGDDASRRHFQILPRGRCLQQGRLPEPRVCAAVHGNRQSPYGRLRRRRRLKWARECATNDTNPPWRGVMRGSCGESLHR